MKKSINIEYNVVHKKSVVRVSSAPAVFGKNLPAFWIKAHEDTRTAQGFAFSDKHIAGKMLVDFAAACWRKWPSQTIKTLDTLVKAMKKLERKKSAKI